MNPAVAPSKGMRASSGSIALFATLAVLLGASHAHAQDSEWEWAAQDYRAATVASHVGLGFGLAGVGFAIAAGVTQKTELLAPAAILGWGLGPPFANGGALSARKALKRMRPGLELTAAPGAVGFIFWAEFPPVSYLFAGIQLGKNAEAWRRLQRGDTTLPRGDWEEDDFDEEDWGDDFTQEHSAPRPMQLPHVVPVVSPAYSGLIVLGTF